MNEELKRRKINTVAQLMKAASDGKYVFRLSTRPPYVEPTLAKHIVDVSTLQQLEGYIKDGLCTCDPEPYDPQNMTEIDRMCTGSLTRESIELDKHKGEFNF